MRYSYIFIGILINFHILTASESIGCKALGLATKDDIKVASVGVDSMGLVCWDTELFFNALESWKRGNTPITCCFFFQRGQPTKDGIENHRSHFRKLPFCFSLMSYADGHMTPENRKRDSFTAGSLTFAFFQPGSEIEFPEYGFFERLLEEVFTFEQLNRLTASICNLTLADFERLTLEARKIFFTSRFYGNFEETVMARYSKEMTIKEFFELLQQRFSYIQQLRKKCKEDVIRVIIDDLEKDLENYIKRTKEFIFSLEKDPKKSLVSVYLKIIRSESSFLNAEKKAEIMFTIRYPAFDAFNCVSFIREQSKNHKNIFFMNFLYTAENIYAQLAKIGFQVTVVGQKSRLGEAVMEFGRAIDGKNNTTFMPHELSRTAYLETEAAASRTANFEIEADAQQLSLVQEAGVIFSPEQLQQFFTTLFTADPIVPRIGALPIMLFDPKKTLKFDRRMGRCASKACNKELPRYLAEAFVEIDEPLCSSNCMLSYCLKYINGSIFDVLSGSGELSEQEQEKLKKYAILCYLRWLTLSPSITQEDAFFYRLNHKSIGEALETIEKTAQASGWEEILKDTEKLGIKLSDLKIIFRMYEIVKKNYLTELFAKSKAKGYEAMNDFQDTTVLDREGKIAGLQKVHKERAKKALHFGENTPDTATGSLYFALFQKILERLGIKDLDCIGLLKNEKPRHLNENFSASIHDIMRELGYVNQKDFDSDSDDEMNDAKREKASSAAETDKKTSTVGPDHPQKAESARSVSDLKDSQELKEGKITKSLPPVIEQKKRSDIHVLNAKFAERLPYKITLFRAKQYFEKSEESKEAHIVFKTCQRVILASRLKLLFGLAEKFLASNSTVIERDRYDALVLKNVSEPVDPSFEEKLNINHLFPHSVDDFLPSYGIVERDKDLIRVSIPAVIQEESGQFVVGFFQYTFIPKKWICIHRCFVHYTAHKDDEKYVSEALRAALYRFLTEKMADHLQYHDVIADLKRIIEQ